MIKIKLVERAMCAADALYAVFIARWRLRPFWRKMYASEELIAERRVENATDEAETRCWLRSRNKHG